jgi:hypothetical protein
VVSSSDVIVPREQSVESQDDPLPPLPPQTIPTSPLEAFPALPTPPSRSDGTLKTTVFSNHSTKATPLKDVAATQLVKKILTDVLSEPKKKPLSIKILGKAVSKVRELNRKKLVTVIES